MRPTLQLFVPSIAKLHLLTSTARASGMFSQGFNEFLSKTESAILGGVDCIQYRPNGADSAIIMNHIAALKKLCEEHQIQLVINSEQYYNHLDIARSTDGLWIDGAPQNGAVINARSYLGDDAFLGVSHSLSNVQEISSLPPNIKVNAVSVGNVFGSTALASRDISRGISEIRQFKDLMPHNVPLFVGGVGQNVKPVMLAGADVIGVSDYLLQAPNPQAAAERLAMDTLQFTGIVICVDEFLPY